MAPSYAVMCGELASRTGQIYAVLVAAADADPKLAALLTRFETQRLTSARQIATAVRDRGGLRAEVDLDAARDIVWIANAPELYMLAVKRRWSRQRYVAMVGDLLARVL